jgi:hypothetical protein
MVAGILRYINPFIETAFDKTCQLKDLSHSQHLEKQPLVLWKQLTIVKQNQLSNELRLLTSAKPSWLIILFNYLVDLSVIM